MKNVLMICLLFGTLQLAAQQETLFSKARLKGVWGGPLIEWNNLGDNFTYSYGGGGGLVFSNFFLGAYGLGSTDFDRLIDGDDINLDIAHGGLWLGYTYRPYKVVHPYASVRMGWGAVGIDDLDDIHHFRDIDRIFAVTPEIGLELNVTKFFHIAATAGYRWVDGVNNSVDLTNEDFRGFNAALNFRFGWFGNRWDREKEKMRSKITEE